VVKLGGGAEVKKKKKKKKQAGGKGKPYRSTRGKLHTSWHEVWNPPPSDHCLCLLVACTGTSASQPHNRRDLFHTGSLLGAGASGWVLRMEEPVENFYRAPNRSLVWTFQGAANTKCLKWKWFLPPVESR